VSIGIACYPSCGAKDLTELIRFADEALYEAKRAGRNKTVFFTTPT
jgi:diguanylate cyclase (GGDEF)-like protein